MNVACKLLGHRLQYGYKPFAGYEDQFYGRAPLTTGRVGAVVAVCKRCHRHYYGLEVSVAERGDM